jgi:hypothetical protein
MVTGKTFFQYKFGFITSQLNCFIRADIHTGTTPDTELPVNIHPHHSYFLPPVHFPLHKYSCLVYNLVLYLLNYKDIILNLSSRLIPINGISTLAKVSSYRPLFLRYVQSFPAMAEKQPVP